MHQQQIMHQQQVKAQQLMNVVAPAMACPPSAAKKIRRKTDNKPQSQINKCNNEKRRRELENEYIEQLGEFLQINKRDMTTTKPDKAAILSEVVKTFRRLLDEKDTKSKRPQCHPDCTDSCTVHPVQQGEVSSTEPETFLNGHSPEKTAYFEAVRHYISNIGWVLLEINSEGVIECATENVCDVLHYTRAELQGKSIYSYLHPGDHSRLSPILDKHTFSLGWDQDQDSNNKKAAPMRVRWLIKQTESVNDTIEQKQQRQDKYKDLLIMSAPLKDDAEESPSMLCLITMPEDDQPSDPALENTGPGIGMNQQFTVKMDINGKISQMDTTILPTEYRAFLAKERVNGVSIQDLCHYQDRSRLMKYMNDVRQTASGDVHSEPFRLRVGADAYLNVKAQSKLFNSQNEESFIMAVHTILSDNDMQNLDLVSPSLSLPSTSHSASQSQINQQASVNMGGPLMTSVVNGNMSQVLSSMDRLNNQINQIYNSNNEQQASGAGDSSYFGEFGDLEFPHSTFDMDTVGMSWSDSRPDSRQSATSNTGTPRPPSVSAYSPATCPSPLTSFNQSGNLSSTGNSQMSPSNNNNNSNNTNFNNNSGFSGFGNSNNPNDEKPEEKPNLEKLNEQTMTQSPAGVTNTGASIPQQKQSFAQSERLRNLLTIKRPSTSSNTGDEKNVILKTLLNNDEDGSSMGKCRLPLRGHGEGRTNQKMLEQLLNDKSSDDDDGEGRNKNSELLKQLKKDSPMKSNEDIIQMLKYQGNDRKRPAERDDSAGGKREGKKTTLQEKNKMLASLLANPSKAPIESSLTQQMPVRVIPDIPKSNALVNSGISSTTSQISPINTSNHNNNLDKLSPGQRPPLLRKPSSDNYLSTMPNNNNNTNILQQKELLRQLAVANQQHQQSSQPQLPRLQPNFQNQMQPDSPFNSGGTMSHNVPLLNTSELDPELQAIINDMIDYMPDNEGNAAFEPDLENLLGLSHPQQQAQMQQDVEKKMAINAIQQQLMQCETNAYAGSPPAYAMHAAQVPSQMANFPPPPNYSQQRRLPPQQQGVTSQGLSTAAVNAVRMMAQNPTMYQRKFVMEKERLLRQQQGQKIVVPVNATSSGAEQICNYYFFYCFILSFKT